MKFVDEIMTGAKEAGAEAIVTPCSLCHFNLEIRQASKTDRMPIFYFIELKGLAFGLEECSSWFRRHLIDPSKLLDEKGLAMCT